MRIGRGIVLSASLLASCGTVPLASPATGSGPGHAIADDANTIEIAGGVIEIELVSKPSAVSVDELREWIRTAARAVSGYYGKYPVKRVTISVSVSGDGHDINGRTYDGRRIEIGLGAKLVPGDLADEWIMTHEMFHLAFPDLAEKHLWMNEGLSTYLEPVARVRIGTKSAETIWQEMVEGMPQGLPEPGDKGLDRTHTWGRTYWGGCLFWLLADVRIRERTHGRKSLQDALRAILDEGGDGSRKWAMSRVLGVADAATGTKVLAGLYAEQALKSTPTDLDRLWNELGVRPAGGRVTFDDAARLAGIRRSITSAAN